MSLTFILGGAGTGKSTLLRRRLIDASEAHPNRRHILLVPEQFTMQTQRDVVAAHPRGASLNIDVLSFERLASRILDEAGGPDLQILTDMGKNMLLRRAAGAHRNELTVYRRSLGKKGFVSRLQTGISELYQYGITEEELSEKAEELADQPLLAGKLHDLHIFYGSVNEMRGDGVIAAEEILSVLNRLLPSSSFLRDSYLALDHFTGFTPVQYEIIGKMLEQTETTEIALTLPREEIGQGEARPQELFYMSKVVWSRCRALAEERAVPVHHLFCQANLRHTASPALHFLTRHFLRLGPKENPPAPDGEISAFLLRSPRQEAFRAAASIAQMVREEGLRYRQIAVIVGDMEEYRPVLTEAFRRENIPFFMDTKAGILGNPVVEYLRSALQTVEKDFSYETLFRHLKCGIGSVRGEILDQLDNYVLAHGIRGKKSWARPFTIPPEAGYDLEELNRAREAVWEDLEPLDACRREKNTTVSCRTGVLRVLLERADARKEAEAWADALREGGDLRLAEEYEKVVDFLMDFFAQMDDLLGEEILPWQEFTDILDAGLSEATLGSLPTGLDLVMVGNVRRSRLAEIRVLIVLGMNDGVIPAAPAAEGLFSEWERALLREHEMELAPTAQETSCQENFSLYSLFCSPCDRLILSCSKMGEDGTPRRISYLLTQILRLFPGLSLTDGEEIPWRERITGSASAWEVVSETVGSQDSCDPAYRELVHSLADCEGGKERMDRILEAAFSVYRGRSISERAARALYGPELTGSVTRLELYASCACAQFLSYGLRLTERRQYDFTGADRGSLIHKALEEFFARIRDRGLNRRLMSEEERGALAEEAVRAAWEAQESEALTHTSGGQKMADRISALAERTILVLCRQLDEGDFEPEAVEQSFNGRSSRAMNFPLGDGERMVLRGIVDRLDIYEDEESRYVKIVDYKTGNVSLDLNDIFEGLQLQLMVYLDAVLEMQKSFAPGRKVLPAGIYYYSVKDPLLPCKDTKEEEQRETRLLKKLQLQGLTNAGPVSEHLGDVSGDSITAEQFEELRQRVRGTVRRFGQEILKGNTAAAPYRKKDRTGCDYCVFSGICGFDLKIPGTRFRDLTNQNKEEIWQKIGESIRSGGREDGEVDSRTTESH